MILPRQNRKLAFLILNIGFKVTHHLVRGEIGRNEAFTPLNYPGSLWSSFLLQYFLVMLGPQWVLTT